MKLTPLRLVVLRQSCLVLLDCALGKKIESCRLDLSSKDAWLVLRTVRVVEIRLEIFQYKGFEQPLSFYHLE